MAAVGLSVAWIAFRRLPGLAWLALLVLAFLFVGYLAVGLVPSVGMAIVALIMGGIIVPVGVAAIASAIGHAVMRRRTDAVARPA